MRCDSLNIPIGHMHFIQGLHSGYSILHVWGLFLQNAVVASIFLKAAYSSTVQMNKLAHSLVMDV